ncbi:MAG: hypothetical protein AAFO29_20895, partial [Actinomycetota bacterium]
VGFDAASVADCSAGTVCYERPYASDAIGPELGTLRSSGEYILFPVYNYADFDRVHVIGMVRARLYDYQLSGDPSTWYIELKVDPGLVAGTCCGPGELRSGSKVVAICGVDPAASANCEATAG